MSLLAKGNKGYSSKKFRTYRKVYFCAPDEHSCTSVKLASDAQKASEGALCKKKIWQVQSYHKTRLAKLEAVSRQKGKDNSL